MTFSAPADATLKPKAPVRKTTDISDLMLFMFITSFPANSWPLLYETQVLGKNSLKSFENCFPQTSFRIQDRAAEKYFRERVGLPGKGAETPSLGRISCLTAILPLEPALEVALLGLNFFLSQRIVITGSVEVDDVTLARILENRAFPTQSPLLDRRELYVAVPPLAKNILGDPVFVPRR